MTKNDERSEAVVSDDVHDTEKKDRRHPFNEERRAKFIETLAAGWSVTRAAKKAGVHRGVAYARRFNDPDFAKAWDDALEAGTDSLEDAMTRRAKGESDLAGIFLLKGRRPDKYRERYDVNVSGEIAFKDVTDEQLNAMIVEKLTKAGVPRDQISQLKVLPLPAPAAPAQTKEVPSGNEDADDQ